MKKIGNTFLLTREKFLFEIHLRQAEFTYSKNRKTKNKELRIK